MKEMANKAFRLGLIGALASLLLAVVSNFAEPVIRERQALELEAALTVLAGGGKPGPLEENPAPGAVKRWPIDTGGWILELGATGYGGPMTVVASYNRDGEIMVARLMSNSETVGFGKKAEDSSYMEIFTGSGSGRQVPQSKKDLGNESDVVAGATITFTGISRALAAGSDLVKEWEGRK
jgi:electron transport complex protein RnfG